MSTYTYVAAACGFLKVGRAADPEGRVAALQIGNPHSIVLINVRAGDYERQAHRALAAAGVRRGRGEWFYDTAAAREVLHRMGLISRGFAESQPWGPQWSGGVVA